MRRFGSSSPQSERGRIAAPLTARRRRRLGPLAAGTPHAARYQSIHRLRTEEQHVLTKLGSMVAPANRRFVGGP